jgi:hypothetical protein
VHEPSVVETLPQLSGVRIVWSGDYYDGPLDGLAEYEGREYWFIAVSGDLPRTYVLHRISAQQVAGEWAGHREYVTVVHSPAAREVWHREHPEAERPDYSRAPAIGWFRAAP